MPKLLNSGKLRHYHVAGWINCALDDLYLAIDFETTIPWNNESASSYSLLQIVLFFKDLEHDRILEEFPVEADAKLLEFVKSIILDDYIIFKTIHVFCGKP